MKAGCRRDVNVVVQVDEDGQLNHVLFDLLWRQHAADDSALTGVANNNRGAAIPTPSPQDVTTKHRHHDECGEQKRTTRQEAKQRWLKKREVSAALHLSYPISPHVTRIVAFPPRSDTLRDSTWQTRANAIRDSL